MGRRKNVSNTIKDGFDAMKESVDMLREGIELRKRTQDNLIGLIWAQVRRLHTDPNLRIVTPPPQKND